MEEMWQLLRRAGVATYDDVTVECRLPPVDMWQLRAGRMMDGAMKRVKRRRED